MLQELWGEKCVKLGENEWASSRPPMSDEPVRGIHRYLTISFMLIWSWPIEICILLNLDGEASAKNCARLDPCMVFSLEIGMVLFGQTEETESVSQFFSLHFVWANWKSDVTKLKTEKRRSLTGKTETRPIFSFSLPKSPTIYMLAGYGNSLNKLTNAFQDLFH